MLLSVTVLIVSVLSAFAVWFAGFDTLWAIATVLAFGAVGVVLSTLKFEEQSSWDPPGRETPRGIRLTLPMMEEALAACDRLARPSPARRFLAVLINERDDRLARGTLVRQMRALLAGELRARGLDATRLQDEALVALLGADALAVFQPNDDNPLTTTAIENCLDAVERLTTEPLPSK